MCKIGLISSQDIWGSGELLQFSRQRHSIVFRARFLCNCSDESLVESIHNYTMARLDRRVCFRIHSRTGIIFLNINIFNTGYCTVIECWDDKALHRHIDLRTPIKYLKKLNTFFVSQCVCAFVSYFILSIFWNKKYYLMDLRIPL